MKLALITGATKGIGRSTAQTFAKAGWNLILLGRDLPKLQGLKNEFEKIVSVKVRSTGKLLKAKINFINDIAKVEILEKETGISPGQACVFYSKDEVGDKVLGGGWIDKTYNNNLST